MYTTAYGLYTRPVGGRTGGIGGGFERPWRGIAGGRSPLLVRIVRPIERVATITALRRRNDPSTIGAAARRLHTADYRIVGAGRIENHDPLQL